MLKQRTIPTGAVASLTQTHWRRLFPRNPHRFSFVRKLLMSWHARASTVSTEFVQESFMNQHVNRRNLVSGSAAVAVSLGAVPAFAKAKKFQRSKFDELEAAFTTAHDKLIAMGEAHSAAEGRYRDERVKLAKPTFREAQPMGREEREALMRMTLAEIRDGTSCRDDYEERKREYEAEMQAYDEAVEAIRRKVFDKIDRAYNRQVDRVTKAADAVLEQPAETLDDLAVKVRVQRTWWGDFEDDSVTSILDDVIRLAGKSQSSSSIN